ncbi:hypothetical protein CASFOL_001248 [Castilleja foliolosa]|uniref:KIB1-4 beta-propeller domain-containing protein n=1 Tax=Castilleja foliolosa TaxID=1961234 RepID=A0ABD3ENZ5_9LAMI
MASSVKRCWITGFSLLGRISARSLSNSRDFAGRRLGAQMTVMMMSTGVDSSLASSSRKISPWLMLPPVIEEGGDTVYKFYNLSGDKEESFRKKRSKLEEEIADAKFVGSSHGWLALFNQRNNNNLFLYNPITGRHIKLPPIETLPDPMINLTHDGRGSVSKLILSSSPDDDVECISMMTFGPGDRLAFCHPCRSTEWTPIGELFFTDYNGMAYDNPFIDDMGMLYGRAYEDFVYCSRLKRFTCITQFEIDMFARCLCFPTSELEDWDLSDPHSPISTTFYGGITPSTTTPVSTLGFGAKEWINQDMILLSNCRQIPYLVFDEQHDQLFIVIRLVIDRVTPDIEIEELPYDTITRRYLIGTYKTIGFCVLRVEYHKKDGRRVAGGVRLVKGGALDGLTMFIGMNHSFAVSSADFPNLKPNSIYFTDANKNDNSMYGGQDIGIFDYANKTLSDCYCYPCVDVPSLKPPMWFTPSLY